MYVVTGKITRQNVSDAFYTIADDITPSEIKQHWVNTYKTTGKCTHIEVTVSQNQLELETVQLWQDQASYEEYKNDPILINGLFSIRDAYWAAHGITGVVVSEVSN